MTAERSCLQRSETLQIALDGMGGDYAPKAVVRGAAIAKIRMPELHYAIYGDENVIAPLVEAQKGLRDNTVIHHTPDRITNTDKPSQALRSGKNSSMNLAIQSVADKQASAVISSGNTGCLVAFSMFGLKRLPGVSRPGIASFFPTKRGESCLLDVGGGVDADVRNLLEFAIMGEAFAYAALGIQKPSVGLLNIGVEEAKGRQEIKRVAAILKDNPLGMQFSGFVEGDGIPMGAADVFVTDGFTGNVVIKTSAGVSRLIKHCLEQAFKSSLLARLAYPLYRGALRNLNHHIDPRRYNGAVLLGLEGIAIKSHGNSDEVGFASAIELAYDLSKHNVLERMRTNLKILETIKEQL